MHILYNGETYPIENFRPSASAVVWTGLHGLELPISGSIVTRRDEDLFALRSDDPADYERCIYENGTLTLTNAPEPEPYEPPDIPDTSDGDDAISGIIAVLSELLGLEEENDD